MWKSHSLTSCLSGTAWSHYIKFNVRLTLKDVEPIEVHSSALRIKTFLQVDTERCWTNWSPFISAMNQNIFADCYSFAFWILTWVLLSGAGGKIIFGCVSLWLEKSLGSGSDVDGSYPSPFGLFALESGRHFSVYIFIWFGFLGL